MLRQLILALAVTAAAMAPVVCADEAAAAPPADPQQSVDQFLDLLHELEGNPEQLDAVRKSLESQIDALKKSASESTPQIDAATVDLDAKSKQIADLETQIAEFSAKLEAAKTQAAEVDKQVADINAKLEAARQSQADAQAKLDVYTRSLELLSALAQDPKPAEQPAAAPAEAVEAAPAVNPRDKVNFDKDIRPILTNNCFACHGPDENQRKAGLRLDSEETAMAALSSGHLPVVPGDRNASEVFKRISTTDPDDLMPPADTGKTLKAEQIELIGKWIDQGGKYEKHWAFVAPVRPEVPAVQHSEWVRNPIDNFIAANLEQEGIDPNAEAEKRALIRRVTLDLTGLPPTLDEIESFENDTTPDAYEKVVDRLLASPHYGEQMARRWLDVARYADTNGYHIDNVRSMWRWREWVIDAYNKNIPFDQFTIEQLAGDLLPESTLEQQIATGFNRNHMITFEGGIIPEEYRVQYVVDRINTTGSVWMGLTVGCAQCHDHKFDPISMREFYSMYAFFNSVPEQGSDGNSGNAVPKIKAPTPDHTAKLAELDGLIASLVEEMRRPIPELDAAQSTWEGDAALRLAERWLTLEPTSLASAGGATLKTRVDRSVFVEGENPDKDTYDFVANMDKTGVTAIRLEAIADPTFVNASTGRSENGNFVLTEFEAEIASIKNPELIQKVTFASATADFSQDKFPVAQAIDGNPASGWAVDGANRPEDRAALFIAQAPFGFEGGTELRIKLKSESEHPKHTMGCFRISVTSDPNMQPANFSQWYVNGPYIAEDGNTAYTTTYEPETTVDLSATYEDHRLKWIARPDYPDGQVLDLFGDVAATFLYRTISAPTAREMTLLVGSNDAVKVWLNGNVVHDNNVQRGITPDQDAVTVKLDAGENRLLVKVVNYGSAYNFSFRRGNEQVGEVPMEVERVLGIPADQRNETQVAALRDFYRSKNWPEWKGLDTQLAQLRADRKAFDEAIPTVMVMAELETPRETFILNRGQYDQPKDKVEPAVPAAFPPLPEGAPANRLGFAEWLLDPNHPLTARVAVNRYWEHYFGVGIVKTAEDFGVQGELPSNQPLLDWLATEFIRTGWDVKAMQRLIVTSAAYRQMSKSTREIFELDPENRLLARGPRFRMDAEMVRDNALAVSGLLVPTIGGPSVKPYQPAGIWEEVSYGGTEFTGQVFEQDHGEALYRRSMYTFWKRQAPPPTMLLFDAPSREVCTVRRARTNTPLQALALMNDVQYVEAARALAERMLKEGGADPVSRVQYAFALATARVPAGDECAVLCGTLEKQLEEFKANPEAAAKLVAVGESARDESIDPVELAAYQTVASMILNLDETVTKG